MNLVSIYLQKDYLQAFMQIHGLRIYKDNSYLDYQWRIHQSLVGDSFIGPMSKVFGIELPKFRQLMHDKADCMENGQLFGFKTEEDARTAIKNLDNYLGGAEKIYESCR